MTQTPQSSFEAQIIELRTNQSAFKSDITEIKTAISSLMSEMKVRNQTQWPVIWTAIGVVTGVISLLGGVLIYPMRNDMAKQEMRLDKIVDVMVTGHDLDTRLTVSGARRDDWQRNSEGRSESNRDAIEKLQSEIVPRGEHDQRYAAIEREFADKQRQLDELRGRSDSLYGPRDELTRLSKEVDDLRAHIARNQP